MSMRRLSSALARGLGVAVIVCLTAQADAINYSYDSAGRLLRADYANGTSIVYAYDPAGNLLSRTVTSAASAANSAAQIRKVLNQDQSANDPSHPARRGSTISLLASGLDAAAKKSIAVTIGELPATILDQLPASPDGVVELKIRVPSKAPSGNAPLSLTSGGAPGATGLTVSVR